MIDPQEVKMVEDVIQSKVAAGESFTAYDVTRVAHNNGASEDHSVLKHIVHMQRKFMQDSNYGRTLIPTPGGSAFLYHPSGADIQTIIDRINGVAPVSVAPTATVVGQVVVKNQAVDSDGRLPVYGDMLAAICADPGDEVGLVFDDVAQTITISAPGVSGATPDDTYTVNSDGRIRIAPNVLAIHCNSASGTFEITGDDEQIIIKPL